MEHLKNSLALSSVVPAWDPGTWPTLLPDGPDNKTGLIADCFAFVGCHTGNVKKHQDLADLAWQLADSRAARDDMERECDPERCLSFAGAKPMRLHDTALRYFAAGMAAGHIQHPGESADIDALDGWLCRFAKLPEETKPFRAELGRRPSLNFPERVALVLALLQDEPTRFAFRLHLRHFLSRTLPADFLAPAHAVTVHFPTYDNLKHKDAGSIYCLELTRFDAGLPGLYQHADTFAMPIADDCLEVIEKAYARVNRSQPFDGPVVWSLQRRFAALPPTPPTGGKPTVRVRTVFGQSHTLAACVGFRALAERKHVNPGCLMSAWFGEEGSGWSKENPVLVHVGGEEDKAKAACRWGHLTRFLLADDSTFHSGLPEYLQDGGSKIALVRHKHLDDAYHDATGLTTALHPCLYDFTEEFAHHLPRLVGREDVIADLKVFAASHRAGYFRLVAEAGLGKSALAAGAAAHFGAPAFFFNTSKGVTDPIACLNHLSAELITRFNLPITEFPDRARKDSSFFSQILGQARARAAGPTWLVLDALDEAEQAGPGENILRLPPHLPDGCFVLLTHRPGHFLLRTSPTTPVREYLLEKDSPEQLRCIRRFLQQEIARVQFDPSPTSGAGPDEMDWLSALEHAADGNFMYVAYVLADLEKQRRLDPAVLTALPEGLRGYYEAMWDRLRRCPQDQWVGLRRPLLALLAAAREPITVAWLAAHSGQAEEDIHDLLQQLTPLLGRTVHDSTVLWRVIHSSFHDYLGEKLGPALRRAHQRIGAFYAGEPQAWSMHGQYASRFLAYHLRCGGDQADESAALFTQVDATRWQAFQLSAEPSGAALRNDLVEAWRAAEALNLEAARKGQPLPLLGREVACIVVTTNLVGFSQNLPAPLLVGLARSGKWEFRQCLASARQIPNLKQRCATLTALAAADKTSALAVWDEAILCAKTIQKAEDQNSAIEDLVQGIGSLPTETRASRLLDLFALAAAIPSAQHARRAVRDILNAQSLSDNERRTLVTRVLAYMENVPDDLDQVWLLTDLIGLVEPDFRMGFFRHGIQLLSAGCGLGSFLRSRFRAFLALVPKLPAEDRQEARALLAELVEVMEGWSRRAMTISLLLAQDDCPDRAELLREVFTTLVAYSDEEEDENSRIYRLAFGPYGMGDKSRRNESARDELLNEFCEEIGRVSQSARADLVRAALNVFAAITRPHFIAFRKLFSQVLSVAEADRSELFRRVIEILKQIKEERVRATALDFLVQQSIEHQLALFEEHDEVFGNVLPTFRTTEGYTFAVIAILDLCDESARVVLTSKILKHTEPIHDNLARSNILVALARKSHFPGAPFQAMLQLARRIDDLDLNQAKPPVFGGGIS